MDWLLAPAGRFDSDDRVLGSWRLSEPDGLHLSQSPEPIEFRAVRLPAHRALYLDYEGAVSSGRGVVERVATGTWSPVLEEDHRIDFVVRFNALWRIRGERIGEAPDPADRGQAPRGLWRLQADALSDRSSEARRTASG